MVVISLRIKVQEYFKTIQFNQAIQIYDACKVIREKIPETENMGSPRDFGLFMTADDPRQGCWLDNSKNLDYYLLRNGDTLEYRKKIRALRVRTLDGSIKTIMCDESQILKLLIPFICAKIGIANNDEYDLVRELLPPQMQDNRKSQVDSNTNTLSRATLNRDKKKMEKLRAQVVTDDDVMWVDQSKTLLQQGIDESETILLKRRYFYSDQNVDTQDPVQLNLLYVQCRDGVISGRHPVTQEQAVKMAGLQSHIQYSDFIENRRLNFDAKEFLPRQYARIKNIDKKILDEYAMHRGQSDLGAKVSYVKQCRSLKTYGVTFYLVKEKMKGRNKLVPRLLGVQKDSVLRLDEKTKEVLTSWPLTQVKRWAASPNTFTLDFGDYSDEYYSVQTQEGEQIAQLIAGYIDIIMKRQKPKDHVGIDGEEGCVVEEDEVLPEKLRQVQKKVGISAGKKYPAANGHIPLPGLIDVVKDEKRVTRRETPALERARAQLPEIVRQLALPQEPIRLEPEPQAARRKLNEIQLTKQNVATQVCEITKSVAEIVNLTSAPEADQKLVDKEISALMANVDELATNVKFIAALDEKEGPDLLDATKRMIRAVQELLDAAKPEKPRQELLTAATECGEIATAIVEKIDPLHKDFEETLMKLAKAVANASAELVRKAKEVAAVTEDPELQEKIIKAATAAAIAASELVATAKIVSAQGIQPEAQSQILDAARRVAKRVQELIDQCKLAYPPKARLLEDLNEAARKVTKALNELLKHWKIEPKQAPPPKKEAVEQVKVTAEKVIEAKEPGDVIRSAKALAQATATLVQSIKGEAEDAKEKDLQRRLLGAAKDLADKVTKLVEAAKLYARAPDDTNRKQAMKDTASEIREIVTRDTQDDLQKRDLSLLVMASKRVCSTGTQTISASQQASPYNEQPGTHQQLMVQCKKVAHKIPPLIENIKSVQKDESDKQAITDLVSTARDILPPGDKLVADAKRSVPTVRDNSSQTYLRSSQQQLGDGLDELRGVLGKFANVPEKRGLDVAIETVDELQKEITEYEKAAETVGLMPLPNDSIERSSDDIIAAARKVSTALGQLCSAAGRGDKRYTDQAAEQSAAELISFTNASRAIAAKSDDSATQKAVLHSAHRVVDSSMTVFQEIKRAPHPPPPNFQNDLLDAARRVTQSLNECLNQVPGQRDVDTAINRVQKATQTMLNKPPATATKPFSQVEQELSEAASKLSDTAGEVVVSSSRGRKHISDAAQSYSYYYEIFVDKSFMILMQTDEETTKEEIRTSVRSVSDASVRLLQLAKQNGAEGQSAQGRQSLTEAARSVTQSINDLLGKVGASAPSQRECDNAIRKIQQSKTLLETCEFPVNSSLSYHDSLDTILDQSKALGESMAAISESCKASQHEDYCDAVAHLSQSVVTVIEASAQSAYLVGVSGQSSSPSQPGLIDHQQFLRAQKAIEEACKTIQNSKSQTQQQQVLEAATAIAKYTSLLCNSCRSASQNTSDQNAKKNFVQYARDVANATAELVRSIKTLDADFSNQASHNRCHENIKPFLNSVSELTKYSANFAGVPAKISAQGRSDQKPIVHSASNIIESSCSMLVASKSLAAEPRDPDTWQNMAGQSKNISNSIKTLVSAIKDKAPGQNECEHAIQYLNKLLQQVDQASLSAISGNLQTRDEDTSEGFYEATLEAASRIEGAVEPLKISAMLEAEQISHRINQLLAHYQPLVNNAIASASNTTSSSKQQQAILDQTKTVLEASIQLLYTCKESGGNPKNNMKVDLNEASDATNESIQDLMETLQRLHSEHGMVSAIVEHISQSCQIADAGGVPERVIDERLQEMDFVDYQTRLITSCREITRISSDMSTAATAQPEILGGLAHQLSHQYRQMATDSRGAQSTCSSEDVAYRLRTATLQLGNALISLSKSAGRVQVNPDDSTGHRSLKDAAREAAERVASILGCLQAGSKGTQACINAAATVSGVIGDLDTTIMFASAGTLQPSHDDDRFGDHRENILKTAKALVEDTKALVSGAASNQEQLANAAHNSVRTILSLVDVVKDGSASLGKDNIDAQVMLLNAVKDVAAALGDLIHATKSASGKGINDPAMVYLKDSAKVMVTNVTSLLKTVKTVEDEHARGTRALEATIEGLGQEIRAYDSQEHYGGLESATAEDLIRATRPVTEATRKGVSAGKTVRQAECIEAANIGRKAICDVLATCKAAAATCDSHDTRMKIIESGRDCAVKYRELLEIVFSILTSTNANERAALQERLVPMTQKIAAAVGVIVASAESMRQSQFQRDEVLFAEHELLGAATMVEDAAKKLMMLTPRPDAKLPDQQLNFHELILEACKAVLASSGELIQSTCATQRELVAQGRVSARPSFQSEDGMWSEGLIGAARTVAAACHNLCEAADALVRGHATEEKLISSAKQVAASTAQLLVATRVKAEANSHTVQRLHGAGNSVKRATEELVRAAQQALDAYEDRSLIINRRIVGGIAQEINAQEDVLKKEKELEEARLRLIALRKAKYGDRSDVEEDQYYGYGSSYSASTYQYEEQQQTSDQYQQHIQNMQFQARSEPGHLSS